MLTEETLNPDGSGSLVWGATGGNGSVSFTNTSGLGISAGAALDVFEREPLPAGSPFAGCPNLVLTPHIAGVTRESNARVSTMVAERVVACLAAH